METSQPKLRFPEFKGKWENKLLDNISLRGSGHTPNKKFKNYYNGDIKWVSLADSKHLDRGYIEKTMYEISIDGLKNSSAVLHPKGTVILSRDAGVGKSAVMKIDMAVSQHFIVWKPIEGKLNNWFLYYKLQILKPEFERIAIGNTIKTIGLPYFKKLSFLIPLVNEQTKIANFLSLIDEKINLLEEKKALLEEYKKGIMQKIFNQEIRFKDDNGNDFEDWEEKTLGEICVKAQSGGTPKSTNKNYYDGNIPFLSISDMTKQGKFINYTSNKISNDGLKNSSSWVVPVNSIIYSMYASVGFVAINKIPLATSQAVLNLILNENIYIEYVYYFLLDFQKYLAEYITTGTQGNLNAQTVKKFNISIPNYKEQTKIANFLSAIDEKIALVVTQIKDMQEYKKGLLQQMFV